jgi:hypothetical protein
MAHIRRLQVGHLGFIGMTSSAHLGGGAEFTVVPGPHLSHDGVFRPMGCEAAHQVMYGTRLQR